MKHLRVIATILTLVLFVSAEAQAGVLLRSSRVRSSVSARTPRAHLSRTRKSTAAAARLNPIRKVVTIGSVKDLEKLNKAQEKYNRKYARWQRKKLRAEQKAKRKAEKKKAAEEKKRKKLARAYAKKVKKIKAKQKQRGELKQESAGETDARGGLISPTEKGAGVEKTEKKSHLTFWGRFWRSLFNFGKK